MLDELRVAAARWPEVETLSPVQAERVIREAETRIGSSLWRAWAWQGLSGGEVWTCAYPADGLALMSAILPADVPLWLFVTDDDPPPWPGLRGTATTLLGVLGDLPFVEYFVLGHALDWVVFDTHDNVLVGCGAGCPLASRCDPR